MNYEPRPDSVAFRALAHMELLYKGSEITTGMLATALRVDSNGLATQLGRAVEARLLFVRQKGGHLKSPTTSASRCGPTGRSRSARSMRRPSCSRATRRASSSTTSMRSTSMCWM